MPRGCAFAGLYEFWRDKAEPDDDPDAWLTTFTIITTAAEPGLDRIHDRMPLVLEPERWADWLDPDHHRPGCGAGAAGAPGAGPVRGVPGDLAESTPSATTDRSCSRPAAPEDLVGVVDPMTGEIIG